MRLIELKERSIDMGAREREWAKEYQDKNERGERDVMSRKKPAPQPDRKPGLLDKYAERRREAGKQRPDSQSEFHTKKRDAELTKGLSADSMHVIRLAKKKPDLIPQLIDALVGTAAREGQDFDDVSILTEDSLSTFIKLWRSHGKPTDDETVNKMLRRSGMKRRDIKKTGKQTVRQAVDKDINMIKKGIIKVPRNERMQVIKYLRMHMK